MADVSITTHREGRGCCRTADGGMEMRTLAMLATQAHAELAKVQRFWR
jgi:hypothetical protein